MSVPVHHPTHRVPGPGAPHERLVDSADERAHARPAQVLEPYCRKFGTVRCSGSDVTVAVDGDRVIIAVGPYAAELSRKQAERLASLFTSACWAAGRNEFRLESDEWRWPADA